MSSDNKNADDNADDNPERVQLVVGFITGDPQAAVKAMTSDRYDTPGDLEIVGVMPGVVGHGRAGILLCGKFPARDGAARHIEVLRVPYETLLLALCHATRVLHARGHLRRESMGAFIAGLLEQTQESLDDSELH